MDGTVFNVDFKRKDGDKMPAQTRIYEKEVDYSLDAIVDRALSGEPDEDEIDNTCIDVGDFSCFTQSQLKEDDAFIKSRLYSNRQGARNEQLEHDNN